MRFIRTGAAVVLAGISLCTVAAERPDTIGDPVVVTATRIPEKLSETSRQTIVISRQEIEAGGHLSLVDLLQARGGIEITNSGGLGQPSGVSIRGAEPRHTLVLVDGLRMGSATAGGTAFEHLPLSQIERIEILPGPLSSVYGSDAIGGVIQIFTRAGAGTSARAGFGSYGTREASVSVGRRLDATEFALSAGALETSGLNATRPASPIAQHNPDSDRYRNRNFSGRLTHDITGGHMLGFTAFQSEGAAHFDAGLATDDVNRQTLQAFSIFSRNPISAIWTSLLRLGTTRDDSDTSGAFPGYFRTDQHQATWQNDFQLPVGTAVGGLEYLDQQVASNTLFKQTGRTIASAFAGYSGNFGSHGLQLNARHDDNSQFGGRDTGSIGYSYRINGPLRVRAVAGTAFKAPTFNDLYFPDQPPFFFSNPGLQPERSRNREAGFDYRTTKDELGVTVFQNDISDLITIFTDPATFVSTTRNLSRARIEGAELNWRGVWWGWHTRARLTLQDPRDQTTGFQLRRRARQYGSVGTEGHFGRWTVGADVVGSGERFDSTNEGPGTRMHGYALVNLNASYAFAREWSVHARWNNVFDREYELVQFFNTPGSNLFVWVSWQSR